MRKIKKLYFILGIIFSLGFSQYFNIDIDATGQYQLVIIEDTVLLLDIGDEIGIFDANGIVE